MIYIFSEKYQKKLYHQKYIKTKRIKYLIEKEIPSVTKRECGYNLTLPTLKSLPAGCENIERIAWVNNYLQIFTEPVSLTGLAQCFNETVVYCRPVDSRGPTIHSHGFDCNWTKLMFLCSSCVFTALVLLFSP